MDIAGNDIYGCMTQTLFYYLLIWYPLKHSTRDNYNTCCLYATRLQKSMLCLFRKKRHIKDQRQVKQNEKKNKG